MNPMTWATWIIASGIFPIGTLGEVKRFSEVKLWGWGVGWLGLDRLTVGGGFVFCWGENILEGVNKGIRVG